MTNLFDQHQFPAKSFADLYHQRWRIEEAFKRLKNQLNLEHVSGLFRHAVAQDVAAKILCENLSALTNLAAHAKAKLHQCVHINRAHILSTLKPLLPALLLDKKFMRKLAALLRSVARETYRHKPNISKPRPKRDKPHKFMTQKPC